jgi:hypothetical protein
VSNYRVSGPSPSLEDGDEKSTAAIFVAPESVPPWEELEGRVLGAIRGAGSAGSMGNINIFVDAQPDSFLLPNRCGGAVAPDKGVEFAARATGREGPDILDEPDE